MIFWGVCNFCQKGLLWVYERCQDFFLGLQKNTLRDFLGYCSFHQLKSTIKQTQFTALCGIFMGMLRKFW